MYNLVFEYKVENTLGIFCETSFDKTFKADKETIRGGSISSITLAFVVSKSSVDSGSLWLYVPNSPLIYLTGPNTSKKPTITPSSQTTTTTTTVLQTTTTTPPTTTTTPSTTPTPTTTNVPIQYEGSAGEKLLFVVYSETGLATLNIINTNGSDLSALVDLENLHYSFGSYQWSSSYQYDWPAVSLSPDGKRVAYFSTDSYLCILDLNEGNTTKIKQDTMGDIIRTRYIAWSPDGNKIAYINYRGNLHIINVDGSGDWEVDTANVGNVQQGDYYLPESDQIRHPVWSSDGRHILYDDFNLPTEMDQYDIPMYTKYRDVYSASTDMLNRQITDLYNNARVCSTVCNNRVIIRVFQTKDADGLYVMNTDGTNLESLFVSVSSIEYPKWSPDGNYILVGYLSPKLIDANTLEEIKLPDAFLHIANFVWSPDSQYIACYSHWFGEDAKIFIVRRNLTSNLLVLDSSNLDEDMILIGWIIQQ
jgi:WD40 repeat protein